MIRSISYAGDLAWRLEDAGHPLPDTEEREQ